MPRRRSAVLAVLACAASVAGCGGSGAEGAQDATLILDFQPNAVHAGIYETVDRGFDTGEGVQLHIQVPGASTDAVKDLLTQRAQFAVLDIHDLALARERGRDLVGVMALVQRPLAAVIAQPGIRSPKQLVGRRVGVTGAPSDTAVLDSIVRGSGGDPSKVKATTIGFDAVQALLGGKVDAATAFWDVEGVELQARRPGIREFRVDDYGAPQYPELILCTTRTEIQDHPDIVQGTVTALRRGYREVILSPDEAVSTLTQDVEGLKRDVIQRQIDAVSPAFDDTGQGFGRLDVGDLRQWARWELRFGLVKRLPDVSAMFDPSFAQKGKITG